MSCSHKFLLICCNCLFLLCGIALIVSGFQLFTDTRRILLSRLLAATSDHLNNLPQPLFYYISIGVTMAGIVAVLAAMTGFWATCLHTYCCLSFYFLMVVLLLLAESVVCLAITLWPHCLGISLDETKMVRALQANYGVPGREQFTIAMDLAQTRFGCCGMNSDINYDTSMWKLQAYGQRDWVVPLSCCILENASSDRKAHLDPKPENETQCQSLEKVDFIKYRYTLPCLSYLDNWYREQYVVFLSASLIIAVVEFCVLLAIIMVCTRLSAPHDNYEIDNLMELPVNGRLSQKPNANQYAGDLNVRPTISSVVSSPTQIIPSIVNNNHCEREEGYREVYKQPNDFYKYRYNTTFKPMLNTDEHNIHQGYLV